MTSRRYPEVIDRRLILYLYFQVNWIRPQSISFSFYRTRMNRELPVDIARRRPYEIGFWVLNRIGQHLLHAGLLYLIELEMS